MAESPWFPKLSAIVKREYLERVRTKWFIIGTLIGPVFFAAITIVPAMMAVRGRANTDVANIVIIDATGAGLGERIAAALRDSTPGAPAGASTLAEVRRVAPSRVAFAESLATAEVVRRERRGYLVVDSATLAGQRARYAGRNASSIADNGRLRDAVRRQLTILRLEREGGLTPERAAELTGSRLQMPTERITDQGRGGSGSGSLIFGLILAFMLYILLILYGQNVLRGVMEEKTSRVAEVVVSSVRPEILMAGKILGVGGVALVQVAVWIASSIGLGGYLVPIIMGRTPGMMSPQNAQAAQAADSAMAGMAMPHLTFAAGAAYVLFFILGYLLYSALFAAVGATVNSEQEAQSAAFPVMLPLIASAVLIQVVMTNPDTTLAKAMSWFPLTAPILMPLRMGLTSVSALEAGLTVLGVALTAVGAIWVAARIYRIGLLMYGKRPTIPEILRWIRQPA